MNASVWQGYPAALTCYEIVYGGGSTPGVLREFMYDPALPADFYISGGNLVLLDAELYRGILHALESGDYTNLPPPLNAAKLEGRDRMIQIGYAKRQLKPPLIESISPIPTP